MYSIYGQLNANSDAGPATGFAHTPQTLTFPTPPIKINVSLTDTILQQNAQDGILYAKITDSCKTHLFKFDRTGIQEQTTSNQPSTSNAPKLGDLDNNGTVDVSDFNSVVSSFDDIGPNLPADVNHDGTVDIFDLNIIISNFNG